MPLSRDEVQHVANIFRLKLDESEIQQLQVDLADILTQFEVLKELDTSSISLVTDTDELQHVTRSDDAQKPFPRGEILANAPNLEDNHFQVPVILEDE